MDNSHSVIDKIYPAIDRINNSIEKDLPASKSTGTITDGDDEERNLDQQENSTDGIILSTNAKEDSHSSRSCAGYLTIIAIYLALGIMAVAIAYDVIVLLYFYIMYGGLYINCHVAMTIVSALFLALSLVFLVFIIYLVLLLVITLAKLMLWTFFALWSLINRQLD